MSDNPIGSRQAIAQRLRMLFHSCYSTKPYFIRHISSFRIILQNLVRFHSKTFLEGFVHVDLEESETPKKTRKSYTYQEKADIIHKYLEAKNQDASLSLQKFAESEHISKSNLLRWLKDKDNINIESATSPLMHNEKVWIQIDYFDKRIRQFICMQ